jgi:hypothetical protein
MWKFRQLNSPQCFFFVAQGSHGAAAFSHGLHTGAGFGHGVHAGAAFGQVSQADFEHRFFSFENSPHPHFGVQLSTTTALPQQSPPLLHPDAWTTDGSAPTVQADNNNTAAFMRGYSVAEGPPRGRGR